MGRPTKHPKTGVYWLRKRVPADIEVLIGRKVITKTRDPEEAKRKHAEILAELEAHWARLRKGSQPISDREAHLLAKQVGDRWFATFAENPTDQRLWHADLYDRMWSEYPLPIQRHLFPGFLALGATKL
jgi:hypothetical protein